jgi:hypothetical protein
MAFFLAGSMAINLLLLVTCWFYYARSSELGTQIANRLENEYQATFLPNNHSNDQVSAEDLEKIWQSPSGARSIYFLPSKNNLGKYTLMLFNGMSVVQISNGAEPFDANLEVTWSPDEEHVLVARPGDVSRMYCVGSFVTECHGQEVFGASSGVTIAYWSNSNTAYVRYYRGGRDIISKLVFREESAFPNETILFERSGSSHFAYAPVSVSPNGRYVLLRFAYEGPPSLSVLDTQTKEIKNVVAGEEIYTPSKNPQYAWKGNLVSFEGSLTVDGNWPFVQGEAYGIDPATVKKYSVDVAKLK